MIVIVARLILVVAVMQYALKTAHLHATQFDRSNLDSSLILRPLQMKSMVKFSIEALIACQN